MTGVKKVFIAEDDQKILDLLRIRLEVAGFHTAYARDGIGALTGIVNSRPDAVILDICLPHRDGFEILKFMRSRTDLKNTPVVMLTARHQTADVQRALLCGAQDYIAKPFDDRELVSRVTRLIQNGVHLSSPASSTWEI